MLGIIETQNVLYDRPSRIFVISNNQLSASNTNLMEAKSTNWTREENASPWMLVYFQIKNEEGKD
jgi:hypothetical protein